MNDIKPMALMTKDELEFVVFCILHTQDKEVAEVLDMSVSGIRYHINKMKKAGIIEHIGPTKKGKWIVHKRYQPKE